MFRNHPQILYLFALLFGVNAYAGDPRDCDWGKFREMSERRHAKAAGLANYPLTEEALTRAEQRLDKLSEQVRHSLVDTPAPGSPAYFAQQALEFARRIDIQRNPLQISPGKIPRTEGIAQGKTFGIFSGDFSPPNLDQVHAVQQAIKTFGLDEVLLLPGRIGNISSKDQMAMMEMAFRDIPQVRLPTDRLLNSLSSSAPQNISSLARRNPLVDMVSLSGSDFLNRREFATSNAANVRYVVMENPALRERNQLDATIASLGISAKVTVMESPGEFSSNKIRDAILNGQTPENVRPEIADYLKKLGVFHFLKADVAPDFSDLKPVASTRKIDPAAIALDLSLDNSTEEIRRQGEELLSLRTRLEQRQLAENSPLNLRYQALEHRNSRLERPLIEADFDGAVFERGAAVYDTLPRDRKKEWLKAVADTRHPSSDDFFARRVNAETDTVIISYLRDIAASRDIPVNSEKLEKWHSAELTQPPGVNLPHYITDELRSYSDESLAKFLSSSNPNVRLNAAKGLMGRSPDYLKQWVFSSDLEIATKAVEALGYRTSDESRDLLIEATKSKEDSVRRLAMRTLSNFRDETSNAANLAALKPTDDDTMMRIVMGGNRIQEIDGKKRLVPGERLTYGGLSDSDFTKKMLSADANTVQTALADIRSRPVDVSYALLEHRNPSVRASVADALAVRSVSNRVAILRLLSDPVAEVRLTATKFLVPEQFGKDRQVFLRMMAESDPDIAVRARARSNLVSISSAIPGVSYHQPRALLQSKFVADLRQELGNVALREDHFLPIAIAKHVYTLPEYEQAGVKTGRELVDRLYNAEATTPPGYRLAGGMGDLRTGFKGGIYLPEALGSTDPTIIAIAGSQTLSDWLVDGGMGRMQARGRFYSDLLERTIKEFKNTNNPIVITGHSLGGGMAQMFGHDLVKELEAQGFKNALDRVKVVSFNGFGATEPLREMGRLDERIAKNLDVTFYHVNGDPVSAIGTPLGSPSKRFEVNQSEYKAFWNIHIMAGVDAALLKVGGLSTTKLQEASIAAALSHASGPLGNVTESVQAARYWWKKDAWLSQLADASKILAGERGWAHINPEFEWFKTEMNIAVDRFAGAEKADRSLILADVDKFRANVNATLQVPASEPLPRFLEQRLSSEELLAMGRKEEATQVKEVATDIMKQNVLGTAPKPGPPRHLQPEIWNSLETKMPGAEQRVKDTENALRTMKIVNFEDVGIGLSQPKRLTFEDGTQGLWKPYEAYFNNRPDSFRTANGNSELAAYAVDRFLGLNLVPITVERDFEGQRGTVQLWVSNSRMGTTASAKELNLFDHLINEPDRNGVNFLYAPSRLKPIAIDHGGAFGNGNPEDLAKLGRPEFAVDVQKVLDGLKDGSLTRELALNQVKGLIDPDVIERLRASTADDWKKTLGGLLTENQIDQLLLRRDKIVSLSEELEAQLGKSIFTANPDVPDLRHSLVTVSPREAHLTESYIGLAQVRETLDELGRNSSGFKDLRNGARKMAEREIPAVKGPDLWTQSKEARVYLLDGHHEDTALYQLRFGAYDDLPKSVRNVISADDQRELAADSKLDLRVNVEKTYATREEMTTDFAKRGIGLFSEASEKQYAALLAKARAGDELTGAEQARLVAAYQTIPKNVPKLTDDPSAAAIAKVFRDANIDSDLRDYARYQIQKGINGEAIKALGITTENALTPKVQEGLKHLMLDNPDGLRELRGLTKKGKDKDGFAYKSRTDAAIDQAVAARKSSLEYKMTNVIGDGMRLDAEPKIRGKIEVPTKEESQARLDAAAQLWHEGRPDDAFRAKIAAVGKTGAIDPSFAPELKNVRDRLKLYRFLCHAVCKDTESLGQLDTLTAAMGHLTDAGKFGDKAKIKAEAKILADYLTPSYLKGVDKEITSMRALGRHDLGDQIDEMVAHMRKTMGKSELTEKQFHETRKDLGRLQTLVLLDALDGKRPVANSSSYQAMRKVYESLGAEHDKIVETIFKDPANLAAIHFTPEQTQGLDRVLRYFEPGSDSVRHSLVGALPTKLQEVKSLLKDPAALEARSASNLALKREKLGKLSADEEALIDKVKSLPFRVEHRSVEADAASKSEEGLLPLSQAPGGKAQVTSFEDKVYGANDFVYATGSSTGWAGQEHYGKAVFEVKPEFWKQNSWASSSEWWREARAKINYKNVDKNIDKLDLTKTRENFAKDLFVPKDYGEQIALETVKALRENPALSIKKFLAEDAEGLKKLMYQNHLGYLEIKLPPVPADQLVSLSEKAVVRAKVDMAEERAVLKTRADRVLREQGETQARAELSSAAAKEIHQRNDRILELEAQMAKLMQNRELAQVPKRYVYEMKGAEKAPLAPALAATTEQKDTLLRQYPQTHLLYDPVLNNYAGSGALTNSGANSISVGYFSQLLSNKEMDVFLEHEGLHLSLSKKNEKGIPTAFDAYFQSNGKKKLGKPPYTTSLYKQEEATHRMQTKLTLRYAEDAAAVREIYGEKAVPANLLRELSSQGINLDKISSDGKIKGGFTALDNYRELTAGSLSQLEEVKKALDAKGAKAYTLGVSETGLPMAKFVNKGKDGQFETSAEIYLAKEVPNMKKGKWVPSPRLAHQEIEEQVERMTSASRMLHAEAEKLAAELAPGPDAGKIVQSTAAKTKMTAQETAQLEKLTEEHAKEVQKVMELLGHKDGSVVMLKKGEETKGLEAHKFEEPRHSLVSGREPASMVETPHPHESDLTAHLDMEHPETQEMKLREVDRDLMSTLRDNKEKKEFSYVVDEENRIHAVEGRLKFGEGHLRIANVREGNALKSFLVKESGQILYDTKAKKYTFKADYGLDLSKAEHDATLADLKKKIPPEMLAKPDAGDDYAKVLDCTSQLEEQLSGKGDALTRVIMRNVSSTGMEGLKQLDLMYRYSDDPEELHARERKLWTSFFVDIPRRTGGAWTSSLVGKPLISYNVNPYAAFGARYANGAAINYASKELLDYTTYYVSGPPDPNQKKHSGGLTPDETRHIMYYNDANQFISPFVGGITDRAALDKAPMKKYEACKDGSNKYIVGPRMIRAMESGYGVVMSIPKYWLWGI